ncbi:tetratricopeptide repeat protein [Limnohabitans sp.]|uniref:O-linked N-acetylglucosamine transferase, SPINDLY family protein n=1 Tax=Limnohabitans sp. TaxID=1907725 RepID=UPI00286F6E49|nr:tetratricopeptide repeat protein [Limnohabitans sp.]
MQPSIPESTDVAQELPQAAATYNEGNAHFRSGRWAQALQCYEQCLKDNPQMEPAALQLARCWVNLGDGAAARQTFTHLLKAFPNNYSAWLEAGHLCRQQGVPQQAVASYQKAVQVAPERFEARLGLARVLEELGEFEGAAAAYHHALNAAGAEKNRTVHWRMAKYRLERGDAARALEAMRQALLILRISNETLDDNERAEMQMDLADIFLRLGMTQDGHRAFERASVATSEATLVRLADLSFRYNLWQEAQSVLRRNVELHPDSDTAHWNLAHSLAESWNMQEALESLARAEAIAPQSGAKSMRASVAGRSGDADTALQLYKALADEEGPGSKMHSSAAMSSLYSDKLSAQEVADLHRTMFAHLGENARTVSSFKNDRSPKRKLLLGLVSADFHHQHPVNIFMQPVLARLNPKAFEVTMYFTGDSHDEQTQLAKRRVAHWVEVTNWSDAQLARRIEEDGIDILLDLSGHTSMQRMALFGQRAAPVQATFLGYPGSTGMPNIDWLVADPVVAPKGSEGLFSEKLARLPNSVFCFAPEVDYPYPNYTQAHATRPLTFGSFNNVPKLTPHTVKLWAAVLHEVPGSRLLLKAPSFKDEGAVAAFAQRFEAEGIARDRLEFRGPVGLTDMMAEYADVDIALDPVPYNGGTTTLQALWMGVPVVVKAGSNFVSRMGASFMSAAGLPEWVADSDADYVRIAVSMAQDRQALLALKQGLRERLEALPAWNVDQYTRDFEEALRKMWTTA